LAVAGTQRSFSRYGRFLSGEFAPSTHFIGGWLDPRAGLDDMEKIRDYWDSISLPSVAQPRSQSLYRLSYLNLQFIYNFFLHNLLNLLVQIENKIGLQKKSI
jgi:hypothetical protein